ncbi:terpenoid synthase [Fomitiporia mediterranea MF3/22]|uniref:terpenoid synthase n=1 Tax=Fomitiporia mediterranea (strain MF3/22) TaxID=694068 RepID=UPI00044099B1|nr:terpenoid synthase [Fomitiporia mediterranea MF3/22]EJD08296.1 terpenoid synthase [Fomitiporia mediterranea MF3/22]
MSNSSTTAGVAQYDNMVQKLGQSSKWTVENEMALTEPFTYITSKPGKEIRGRLIEAFNTWLEVPEEKLTTISKVVSMLHSASLLVDDIEDDAQLRRGTPVAHKIYGVPQTINCANYVYFQAYQELFRLRDLETSKVDEIVTEELLNLHRGQGLELLWRDSLQCPTEEEYIGMVNDKTGGLLRIGIKLLMTCAAASRDIDYIPLVNLIGVFYQIRDDYSNLVSKEYETNKGFAEDLTEGKFSFPIVHGVRADTSNRQVLNVLQKRPSTPTLKRYTVDYLKTETKSFDYTLRVLNSLELQIRNEIARLGGNKGLEKIIDMLSVKGTRENSQ